MEREGGDEEREVMVRAVMEREEGDEERREVM